MCVGSCAAFYLFRKEREQGLIGIGGVVAHSPLPHDRTCGSASGGSAS
jgi:hypothetical protein